MSMTIGKMIKDRRELLGMTQKNLAEALCVTQQAISAWESEQNKPDVWMLNRIADTLAYSVAELVAETPDKISKLKYITNKDTGKVLGMRSSEEMRSWIIAHMGTYVIRMIYGGHAQVWKPKANEKPRVISI